MRSKFLRPIMKIAQDNLQKVFQQVIIPIGVNETLPILILLITVYLNSIHRIIITYSNRLYISKQINIIMRNIQTFQLKIKNMIEKQQHQKILDYFSTQVKPIFSNLMEHIVYDKPEDIEDYCLNWFKSKKLQLNTNSEDEQEQYGNQIQTIPDEQFKALRKKKLLKARKRRIGLSSEAYGLSGKRMSIKVSKGFKKQENIHMNILFFCMNSFLFKNFNESQINDLITMMGQRNFQNNQIVFEEGDNGDSIYFVYEGIFQCYRKNQNMTETLKYYHKGDTFGEICMLHVIKRQASIVSRSQGILFTLDRQSYIHFKKICITKRRALYFDTLKKQPLFRSFSENQLEKICDVLTQVTYEEYQMVINQGDAGKKFYIIIQGILVAFKGKQQNVIQCYKQGDAFGEIALVKQLPRQASVKTLTRCRLVYLTNKTFQRIFQNLNLSKQVEQKYFSKNSHFIPIRRRQ